jgi:hypothetical protein
VREPQEGKGKAYNVTLSDESEEEAPEFEKFLAFVALLVEEKTLITRSTVIVGNSSRKLTRLST